MLSTFFFIFNHRLFAFLSFFLKKIMRKAWFLKPAKTTIAKLFPSNLIIWLEQKIKNGISHRFIIQKWRPYHRQWVCASELRSRHNINFHRSWIVTDIENLLIKTVCNTLFTIVFTSIFIELFMFELPSSHLFNNRSIIVWFPFLRSGFFFPSTSFARRWT